MMWGCICFDSVWTLTAAEGNINSAKNIEILDKNLWPVVVWNFEGKEYLFINDNAPVHRAHTVDNYNDQDEVTSMEWPAESPDLNIIENIWLYMKRELKKVCGKYRYQIWSSAWNPECVTEYPIWII